MLQKSEEQVSNVKLKMKSKEDLVIDGINYTLMTIIIFLTLYPFYYILVYSLNMGLDAATGGIYFFPRKFTLENYIAFFSDPKWLSSIFVTILRTVVGSLVSVFFTCLVSYGLTYKDLLFKRVYFSLIVFTMYFSGGIITYYILLRTLGFLDTFWVYVIPTALNAFFVLISVSFFRDIPSELIESAELDGASEIAIFVRIVIPVSMPLIATMLLFIGVNQWNAWLDSAYFVKSDALRTISFRMMEVLNQSTLEASSNAMSASYRTRTSVTSLSLQMTAMVVATLPIMCVYPFLQRFFVKGIMIGAVKG